MGQLKLLISEIDFLTDYADKGFTIVYAGAADGRHIPVIDSMFMTLGLSWHLFDPSAFHADVTRWSKRFSNRVSLHNECFTDSHAQSFSGDKGVLFISDIRTNKNESSRVHNTKNVPDDNDVMQNEFWQMAWVQMMQPFACCLKFRGKFEYLDGEKFDYIDGQLRIQAWPPPNSTELRLVAQHPYKLRTYSFKQLDEGMSYYNEEDRLHGNNDIKLQDFVMSKYLRYAKVCQPCRGEGSDKFHKFVQLYMDERRKHLNKRREHTQPMNRHHRFG
jgi:hypothetical protein